MVIHVEILRTLEGERKSATFNRFLNVIHLLLIPSHTSTIDQHHQEKKTINNEIKSNHNRSLLSFTLHVCQINCSFAHSLANELEH